MPGVPRSNGCASCHKRKKKCDGLKPTCGLCSRLGIKCVGNGVKRWKFMSYEGENNNTVPTAAAAAAKLQTPSISRTPSSETTNTAAALVHILEIQDIRFDIRSLGGSLIGDLPARIGTSPELDATVSAVVALYNSRQFKLQSVRALTTYGKALTATRRALEKKDDSPVLTMQTMLMIFVCQAMIDSKHAERHRIMVAHVFRDAVMRGQMHQIDPHYITGLCQIAAWASLVDPSFDLGDWFWDTHNSCVKARPSFYDPGRTFHSMEIDTIAAASYYLRTPEENIPQLTGIYNLIQTEKPRIRQLVAMATAAAKAPTGSAKARRLQVSLLFSWSTILGFGVIINNVLRGFVNDATLIDEAYDCYDEALDLGAQCTEFRPFGTGFLPSSLKAVWAAVSDLIPCTEVEDMLRDYERDVEGADHLGDALFVKHRLETLRQRRGKATKCHDPANNIESQLDMGYTEPREHYCVVL